MRLLRSIPTAIILLLLLTTGALQIAQAQGPPNVDYMLGGHTGNLTDAKVAPNNTYYATAGGDGTVKLWNVANNKMIRTVAYTGNYILAVQFTADSNTLIVAGNDANIRVYDVATGKFLKRIATAGITSISLSIDDKTLAVGSSDGNIYLYNYKTGLRIKTLSGHSGGTYAVAFSPADANLLISGGADRIIRCWKLPSGASVPLIAHTGIIRTLAFNPANPDVFASGSDDTTVRLWQVSTATLLNTLVGHSAIIWDVTFSPDGKSLGSVGNDYNLCLWDNPSGFLRKTIPHSGPVFSVMAYPDSASYLTGTGGSDCYLRQWSVSDGSLLYQSTYHYQPVTTTVVAANNQEYVDLNWNEVVRHNQIDGSVIEKFYGLDIYNYSQDSTLLLYNAGAGGVSLKRLSTGAILRTFPVTGAWAACLLADGSVATYDGTWLRVWKQSDGSLLRSYNISSSYTARFSPDGSMLSVGNANTVFIYKTSDGTLKYTLQDSPVGISGTPNMTWSTDSTRFGLLSYDQGGAIRVWDLTTQTIVSLTTPPPGTTYSNMAFSPMGDLVAIYGVDNNSTRSLTFVPTYLGGDYIYYDAEMAPGVTTLAFTADASHLLVGRSDATQLSVFNPYPMSLASVTVAPYKVQGGLESAIGTVNLNLPVQGDGVSVSLYSSDSTLVTIPDSVMVAKGEASAIFTINTSSVTTNQIVTIYATVNGVTRSTILLLEPATPVTALSLAPATVFGGYNTLGVVTIGAKAPAGGLWVTVASDNVSALVPQMVLIPAGKKSTTFNIRTSPVTAKRKVNITATHGGKSAVATLTLNPISIASLVLIPNVVSGGDDSLGFVTLSAPAPKDTVITLKSANTAVAAPSVKTVLIRAGQTVGIFYIDTNAVAVNTDVVISAAAPGANTAKATLTVTP